jgi:hypothetical protein
METRTRILAAVTLAAAAVAAALIWLDTAATLGVALALLTLAYAYGPTVVSGVPE